MQTGGEGIKSITPVPMVKSQAHARSISSEEQFATMCADSSGGVNGENEAVRQTPSVQQSRLRRIPPTMSSLYRSIEYTFPLPDCQVRIDKNRAPISDRLLPLHRTIVFVAAGKRAGNCLSLAARSAIAPRLLLSHRGIADH